MSQATPTEYPAGTRIVNKMNADRGTVLGWVRGSLGVRWDSGGTSHAPAHHWAIVHESAWDAAAMAANGGDRVNICCGHVTCQQVVAEAIAAAQDRDVRA